MKTYVATVTFDGMIGCEKNYEVLAESEFLAMEMIEELVREDIDIDIEEM